MAAALPIWKNVLLSAYYYGTLPLRLRMHGRVARQGIAPIMILFYHRVGEHTPNAWTISYRQFARQIRWLEERFELISLPEAQQRMRAGANHQMAVSVTFDDGYADNCHQALPLLIGKRIPVTYLVATDHVLRRTPFPHDVAAGRPLPPNTIDDLRRLAAAGVEIGCHSRTHQDLGAISDRTRLVEEVVVAREELQQALGHPVRYFSFPYGQPRNLNAAVFSLAEQAGYHGVCSAFGGYNFPRGDAFHLRRVHADPQFTRFRNWLTLDPRKLSDEGKPGHGYRCWGGGTNA